MNLQTTSGMYGRCKAKLINPDGTSFESDWIENVITNLGKKAVVGLTGNIDSQTAFTYIACGTSATAVAATDTTLGAELTTLGLGRAAATVTSEQITSADDTLQLVKSFSVTGSTTVQEVGVFNASSAGVMLSHLLTGGGASWVVVNGSVLVVTYQIKFT